MDSETIVIAEVLSRDFLVSWLRPVQEELQILVDETKDPDGSLDAAIVAIGELQASGSPGQPDDGESDTAKGRRGGRGGQASLDAQSYFCRDPVMSLLQSALDELIEERHAGLIKSEDRPRSGGRRGGSLPAVTARSIGISE